MLVTGATRGIGAAIADAFEQRGCAVDRAESRAGAVDDDRTQRDAGALVAAAVDRRRRRPNELDRGARRVDRCERSAPAPSKPRTIAEGRDGLIGRRQREAIIVGVDGVRAQVESEARPAGGDERVDSSDGHRVEEAALPARQRRRAQPIAAVASQSNRPPGRLRLFSTLPEACRRSHSMRSGAPAVHGLRLVAMGQRRRESSAAEVPRRPATQMQAPQTQ